MAERFASRIVMHGGHCVTERVLVTPAAALPRVWETKANAPRDALVRFCDAHAWHIAAFPTTDHPPVPMRGTIYPCGYADETRRVRVEPLNITPSTVRDGTIKYEGLYRVHISKDA